MIVRNCECPTTFFPKRYQAIGTRGNLASRTPEGYVYVPYLCPELRGWHLGLQAVVTEVTLALTVDDLTLDDETLAARVREAYHETAKAKAPDEAEDTEASV